MASYVLTCRKNPNKQTNKENLINTCWDEHLGICYVQSNKFYLKYALYNNIRTYMQNKKYL
jgi:hypothetical protein